MNHILTLFLLLASFPLSFAGDVKTSDVKTSDVKTSDVKTTDVETTIEAFELIAPCGEDIAEILTEKTLDFAEKIGKACEMQNQKSAPAFRCPFQTCQGEIVKGGYAAPTMEVRVGNSSTSGLGTGINYPGSSNSNAEKIYISTTLKFSLARDPDKVVCQGTLSPAITTPLFTKILSEVASSPVCKKKS